MSAVNAIPFFPGELLICGISSTHLTAEESQWLSEEKIGGVILFAHNYENPAQLAELVNQIQKCRDEHPLWISVDQEGGRVQRFKQGFSLIPAMHQIAALQSPKLVYEVHRMIGLELVSCGINLNFSPVCDLWTNPQNKVIGDRSFGAQAIEVEKYVSAAIRGLHSVGVLACGKHFPGHGSTKKDSHLDLPFVNMSREQWEQTEAIPFIRAAKSRVNLMMMAHLVCDAFDRELPASLSEKCHRALRESCKYDALIITDDMEMKAISDRYPLEQAVQMALTAGADLTIMRSFEEGKKMLEKLKEQSRGPQAQSWRELVQEKIKKVHRLKKEWLAAFHRPIYLPELKTSHLVQEHRAQLEKIQKMISSHI